MVSATDLMDHDYTYTKTSSEGYKCIILNTSQDNNVNMTFSTSSIVAFFTTQEGEEYPSFKKLVDAFDTSSSPMIRVSDTGSRHRAAMLIKSDKDLARVFRTASQHRAAMLIKEFIQNPSMNLEEFARETISMVYRRAFEPILDELESCGLREGFSYSFARSWDDLQEDVKICTGLYVIDIISDEFPIFFDREHADVGRSDHHLLSNMTSEEHAEIASILHLDISGKEPDDVIKCIVNDMKKYREGNYLDVLHKDGVWMV